MKKSKLAESQNAIMLRLAEEGTADEQVRRNAGMAALGDERPSGGTTEKVCC